MKKTITAALLYSATALSFIGLAQPAAVLAQTAASTPTGGGAGQCTCTVLFEPQSPPEQNACTIDCYQDGNLIDQDVIEGVHNEGDCFAQASGWISGNPEVSGCVVSDDRNVSSTSNSISGR